MTTTASATALLDWALVHAALGWHVFPVTPGANKPPAFPDHPADRCDRRDPWCQRAGHVTWEARATVDPDRIRRAWSTRPFNIGVACGRSGLVVVDLDTTDARGRPGSQALGALAAERGVTVPATYTVTTPSAGQHLYFRLPPGVRLRNTRDALGPNIDTRAAGGYVIGAGSTRPDGGYELADDTDPAELPAWLVQALFERSTRATTAPAVRPVAEPGAYATAALRGEADRVRAARRHEHNAALSGAAYRLGQLAGTGLLNPDTIRTELTTAAAGFLTADCDCTQREITRVIQAAMTAGIRRPRSHTERPVA